jgi:hypothetical protein
MGAQRQIYLQLQREEEIRNARQDGTTDTCFACHRTLLRTSYPHRELKKPLGHRCCASCAQTVPFPNTGPELPQWVLDKILRLLNSVELVQADMACQVPPNSTL